VDASQYREDLGDSVVTLESHQGWREAIHWVISTVLVFFDGDTPEAGPWSARVVIRRSGSGRVLYSEGPYDADVARLAADEAVRVIRVLGVDGYIRRETHS